MEKNRFKGKRKDNGEWIEGTAFKADKNGDAFILAAIENEEHHLISMKLIRIDRETVCEFTGRTDAKGKEIFGGDILGNEKGWKAVVCFSKESNDFEIVVAIESMPSDSEIPSEYESDSDKWEVIGNIHDNPELLGGANNGKVQKQKG